ncbi:MAG: DUF1598 domain-containing protein [Planctomycetaceae bacterium]|nr:DUF1598 domain-containing protein [Planctomycetaceae bacterium]
MLNWSTKTTSNRSVDTVLKTVGVMGIAGAMWLQGTGLLAQEQAPSRVAPQRPAATSPSLQGGSGADFTQLMDLIQSETSGLWLEDGLGEGTMSEFDSGIRVDPHGVLYQASRAEQTGRLASLGMRARMADLNEDMAASSTLRLVSLTRLEREVARRMADGQPVVESMRHLAGLSHIQYVFVYPEAGEIVLGGPAEGWRYDEQGRAVGATSGVPTLQLDDFVTVWRTFGDGGQQIFGCSIDPQPENIKALKEFAAASQQRGPLNPSAVRGWTKQLGEVLGKQNISVYGVPGNSRVARVLVEADYRMKLIGVGKLEGGSNIPDYFELLAKDPSLASGSLDALRWWMTMNYDEVLHSPDHQTFEVRGSAVKCQSENQFLTDNGQRVATGKAEPVNQQFAQNFTEHYMELVKRDPIFADLKGVFDLALVSALLHHEGVDDSLGWEGGVFAANGEYQPAAYPAPRQCDSVVNHRVYNGRDIVVQVAGGVRADLLAIVKDQNLVHESPRLDQVSNESKAPQLPEGRWWWDAQR